MRTRVTRVKMNYRGEFENLQCTICDEEYESQQHIIECLEIRKMKETENKIIEYEKLFGENVEKQLEIAKCFLENMNIKSKLEKRV